jgi:hypothetical protein
MDIYCASIKETSSDIYLPDINPCECELESQDTNSHETELQDNDSKLTESRGNDPIMTESQDEDSEEIEPRESPDLDPEDKQIYEGSFENVPTITQSEIRIFLSSTFRGNIIIQLYHFKSFQ